MVIGGEEEEEEEFDDEDSDSFELEFEPEEGGGRSGTKPPLLAVGFQGESALARTFAVCLCERRLACSCWSAAPEGAGSRAALAR